VGANLDQLDPELKQACLELQQACSDAGLQPTITSTVRTAAQQDFLWKRYKRGNSGGLPAAPVGHSAHEYGWAFDMIVSPTEYQSAVGRAWEREWGGKWGGARDPVHFEFPGASQLAWQLGEQGAQPAASQAPEAGGAFYALADFLSSFVPVLGEVQLVNMLVSMLDHNNDIAAWYLNHPAEAVRDLAGKLVTALA